MGWWRVTSASILARIGLGFSVNRAERARKLLEGHIPSFFRVSVFAAASWLRNSGVAIRAPNTA